MLLSTLLSVSSAFGTVVILCSAVSVWLSTVGEGGCINTKGSFHRDKTLSCVRKHSEKQMCVEIPEKRGE